MEADDGESSQAGDAYEGSPFVARDRPDLLRRAVPVSGHLEGYERSSFVKDAVAGVTVAALAVPSAMGFAEVAGLPPVAGLYALLLPVVAYARPGHVAPAGRGPRRHVRGPGGHRGGAPGGR